jgi:hypothetical protein
MNNKIIKINLSELLPKVYGNDVLNYKLSICKYYAKFKFGAGINTEITSENGVNVNIEIPKSNLPDADLQTVLELIANELAVFMLNGYYVQTYIGRENVMYLVINFDLNIERKFKTEEAAFKFIYNFHVPNLFEWYAYSRTNETYVLTDWNHANFKNANYEPIEIIEWFKENNITFPHECQQDGSYGFGGIPTVTVNGESFLLFLFNYYLKSDYTNDLNPNWSR